MNTTQNPNNNNNNQSLVTFFISRAGVPLTTVSEFRGNGTLNAHKERILERIGAETGTPTAHLRVTDTRVPSEFGFLYVYECVGGVWLHAGEVLYPIFKEAKSLGDRVFNQLVMAQIPDADPRHIRFTQVPSTITGTATQPVIVPTPLANDQSTGRG